jgi:hypothetical protein
MTSSWPGPAAAMRRGSPAVGMSDGSSLDAGWAACQVTYWRAVHP